MLIRHATCSSCTAQCKAVGTRSEGWYDSCDGSLIVWASCGSVEPESAFSDVPASHENSEAIVYVKSHGIVQGYADGTFKPDRTINRAEFTKIITEATRTKENMGSAPMMKFSDVRTSDWFYSYVLAAFGHGMIKGYADGTFRPAQTITFPEAAKIIVAGFGIASEASQHELAGSADHPGSFWYKPFTDDLAARNAIPLTIKNFGHILTRDEMAEMIYRIHAGVTDKPSKTYDELAYGKENTQTSSAASSQASDITIRTAGGMIGGSCDIVIHSDNSGERYPEDGRSFCDRTTVPAGTLKDPADRMRQLLNNIAIDSSPPRKREVNYVISDSPSTSITYQGHKFYEYDFSMDPTDPKTQQYKDLGQIDQEIERQFDAVAACTLPARGTDIGRDVFPIAESYKDLPFLGQIFTADDCGPARLNDVVGGPDAAYKLGSALWLKKPASPGLVEVLQSIGFVCGSSEEGCLKMELTQTVSVKELLKLKPFASEFKQDDCRNCG